MWNLDPAQEAKLLITRRHFFGRAAAGIGVAALGSLLNPNLLGGLVRAEDGAGFPLVR